MFKITEQTKNKIKKEALFYGLAIYGGLWGLFWGIVFVIVFIIIRPIYYIVKWLINARLPEKFLVLVLFIIKEINALIIILKADDDIKLTKNKVNEFFHLLKEIIIAIFNQLYLWRYWILTIIFCIAFICFYIKMAENLFVEHSRAPDARPFWNKFPKRR
jgi:hypothetical protein